MLQLLISAIVAQKQPRSYVSERLRLHLACQVVVCGSLGLTGLTVRITLSFLEEHLFQLPLFSYVEPDYSVTTSPLMVVI